MILAWLKENPELKATGRLRGMDFLVGFVAG